MTQGKKVYVGLSGGVDSSVSALLLKQQGYDVTGVFIKVWQPDFVPCTWREDRLDAMRVCAHLGIPFITLDLEKEYKEGVIDYMLAEYKAGNTPNPDVFCNKEVKFGAFLKWALSQGADYVATGHYAQKKDSSLLRGIDPAKDQSYFLWTLTKEQLAHILFPVGHLKKGDVRKIAEKAGLVTADKKDSQGLCFVSNVDMKQFLTHFIKTETGNVLNESGEVIGTHNGAILYTLGERHGFTVHKKESNDEPYYVVSKNVAENTITVSHTPLQESAAKREWYVKYVHFTNDTVLPLNCEAEIRYHGEAYPAVVAATTAGTLVTFESPLLISPGQSIVFYNKDMCLGGGIID